MNSQKFVSVWYYNKHKNCHLNILSLSIVNAVIFYNYIISFMFIYKHNIYIILFMFIHNYIYVFLDNCILQLRKMYQNAVTSEIILSLITRSSKKCNIVPAQVDKNAR